MSPMPKVVTIFTTKTCAYCSMVKRYLDSKGVTYSEVNLDEHPERQQEAYQLSGSLTVPVTLVQKGEQKDVIIGYNLSKLVPAIS